MEGFLPLRTLPAYAMIAGETKTFTIPIYNRSNKQIDASGMKARFAISDYVNQDSKPLFVCDCTVVVPEGELFAVLRVNLPSESTLHLCGKYVYQITGTDVYNDIGIMNGELYIFANYDK